jgi:hypothetical protein
VYFPIPVFQRPRKMSVRYAGVIFTLSVARDATLRAISQETDTTGCAADSAFTLFEICRSAG